MHDDKNMKLEELQTKYATAFLNTQSLEYDLIKYKCLCFSKKCQQKFDAKLKEQFLNTYTFSNCCHNKFILLLQKNFYPYEFMDHWEKFNKTSLPEREDFYSHLSMDDITDEDYRHPKGVRTDYQLKNLREYYIHYC